MRERVLHIRGTRLLLREKLSKRGTFRAYDVKEKVERLVCILPDSQETRRRIKIWKKLDAVQSVLPKIVSTTDQGGEVVTVSHWVQGRTLKSYLKHLGSRRSDWPSLYESARLFRGFVHGLAHLHGKRIVHGDISTANIILHGPKPTRLVLIDCGSLWSPESSRSDEGDGLSPLYSAPEYGSCDCMAAASQLSDQFSACLVFHELLTGRLPFGGLGGKVGQVPEQSMPRLKPASSQLVDAGHYPKRALRAIDSLLQRGLAISSDDRFVERGSFRAAVDEVWNELQRPLRRKDTPWAKRPVLGSFIRWLAKRSG